MNDSPLLSQPLEPGFNFKRTLVSSGRERWYIGHISSRWDGTSKLPLVVAIHGATSNPRLMERFCGLSDKADQAGFVVIYPAGSGVLPNVLTWNGGDCCGYAKDQRIDDVAWLDQVLADIATILPIDDDRVYFAGMSNGAHMTYRYAGLRPERVAAIACVAGPAAIGILPLSRPVPLVHIHGTEDEFASFHGGRGPKSLYREPLPSVADTVLDWVRACGLPETPRVETIPDRAGDGTTIQKQTYGPSPAGTEVVLYVVEGGGHTWPGMPPLPLSLGKSSANMNANDVIWDFFAAHPRR
jgi:polyhydroxybutyrate depolymerase